VFPFLIDFFLSKLELVIGFASILPSTMRTLFVFVLLFFVMEEAPVSLRVALLRRVDRANPVPVFFSVARFGDFGSKERIGVYYRDCSGDG